MADKKKQQNCDCGCDHDEHTHAPDCDCGCEELDEDVVILQDENGNDIPFYFITTLERDGKEYACLQSADENEEDQVVEIFELEEIEEDGEPYYNFLPVDDELYEILFKQLLEVAGQSDED